MRTKHAEPSHEDALTRDLLDAVNALDAESKRALLAYSRDLARRQRARAPGGALLAFAGAIPADDLDRIEQAIADACETVDRASW